MALCSLSAEELRNLVNYDPSTGIFTSRVRRGKITIGARLGTWRTWRGHGVFVFAIGGEEYRAHRLAWLYVNGEWPTEDIDHIDGDPSNNRISNLRQATDSQNLANARKPVTNTSGRKGVSWHSKGQKWQAHIRIEGKSKYLGLFDDLDAAHAAYASAATLHRGEFARME